MRKVFNKANEIMKRGCIKAGIRLTGLKEKTAGILSQKDGEGFVDTACATRS